MDKRISRRLDKIENKMRVGNDLDLVPLVVVRCNENTKGKGVEIVYENAEEQGNGQ